MTWLSGALPEIVKSGAPWLLVFVLVVWHVRTLRSSYDDRVTELKAHNAEVVSVLQSQQEVDRLRADSLDKVLAASQTIEALVRALPVGKG